MEYTYRKLFKDEEHENEFSSNGYFISKNVLSNSIIDDLQFYFDELFKDVKLQKGFSTPFDYYDISKRFEIHNFILSKLNFLIEQLCIDCEVYLSNYMIKTPEKQLYIDIHQD